MSLRTRKVMHYKRNTLKNGGSMVINSTAQNSYGFSQASRFGDKMTDSPKFSSAIVLRNRKKYDQNSFLNHPSLYTPAPGMYNLGSIFGQAPRQYNRIKSSTLIRNRGQVVSKMDKENRKKYKKKSFKDFDLNTLNRRNMKQANWDSNDLKDKNGNWIIRFKKNYNNQGYGNGVYRQQSVQNFGRGPKDKFYQPNAKKQRVQGRKVGKFRTLPGPGRYVAYSDFAYFDTPFQHRQQRILQKHLDEYKIKYPENKYRRDKISFRTGDYEKLVQ